MFQVTLVYKKKYYNVIVWGKIYIPTCILFVHKFLSGLQESLLSLTIIICREKNEEIESKIKTIKEVVQITRYVITKKQIYLEKGKENSNS